MTPGEIVIIKLDQLLKKTKETLVADVEREFGCIRTAFVEGADATTNAKTREVRWSMPSLPSWAMTSRNTRTLAH